jgi:hypothetical protein
MNTPMTLQLNPFKLAPKTMPNYLPYVLFISLLLSFTTLVTAQTSRTIEPGQPGTLHTFISTSERISLNSLTLKGKIDARDFAFMRDEIKNLSTLNMQLATIENYSGIEGTVRGDWRTYPANEIPEFAFYNPILLTYKPSLITVTLPINATSIGKQAFYFCWNLEAMNIPNKLLKIGDYAFYGCYSINAFSTLASHTRFSTDANGILYNKNRDTLFLCPNARTGSIIIPTTVRHIDKSAFENCYNLTSVSLPTSLLSTGSYAFASCSGISGNLTLPSAVKSLGEGSFYGCYNLTGTVTIPASLTEIGSFCFFQSNAIQAFSVANSNPLFSSLSGMLYSKNTDTLFICPAGKTGSITLPETVRLIGSYAFYNCNKLTGTINIPAITDYIGYYAFFACTGIQAYTVASTNNWFSAENGTLYSRNKDRLLVCPAGYSGQLTLPGSLISIDPGAFHSCTGINGTIQLPASLSWIGEYAFYNCPGMNGFTVDDQNPWFSAMEGVLFNKNADTLYIYPLSRQGNYSLPTGVRHIGAAAFSACTNLTGLDAGAQLESIGSAAFAYCSALQSVQLPKDISSIGYGAFYYCNGLNRFSIARHQPPLIDYYTFDQVDQTRTQLVVPTGTETEYKNAPYWQNFQQIIGETFGTSTTPSLESQASIISTYDGLLITGLSSGDKIEIYNTAGKCIIKDMVTSTPFYMPFSAKGIFILKTPDFAEKFIR